MAPDLRRARDDVGYFAEALIGEPLWDHQLEVARSVARIRSLCSGRQAGKSRVLALLALHEAFRAPGRFVLLLSAGDAAAKDLLEVCASLATGSPLLAGSVLDELTHEVRLSNGSTIRSVPASTKQVRGKSVDLLVIDEACFVDDEVWVAAKFTTIARPDSRIVMASTPWGRPDRFFAVNYWAGQRGEDGFASFRWPSTVSPLVDEALLDLWRRTSTDREYRREVLAEWIEDAGAYFTAAELDGAVDDYDLVAPAQAGRERVTVGVDWGYADANAMVCLGQRDAGFYLPWLEEHYKMPYAAFVDRIAATTPGYTFKRVISEQNGVGAMPTETLRARLGCTVEGVHTSAASKENGFGAIKMLLQQGRLRLPRHPGLLGQLAALEYEERDSGTTHIAVPERLGHDDVCMAFMLAVSGEPAVRSTRRASLSKPTTQRIGTTPRFGALEAAAGLSRPRRRRARLIGPPRAIENVARAHDLDTPTPRILTTRDGTRRVVGPDWRPGR
jgi:hypothetical protein